tara:strand:+ start:196 stop:558 length:363 start_codon:yes stop_codon:yes gene_type:complete
MTTKGKTFNIHEILEFANRAELTVEEFELSYEEEFMDLSKRGIAIQLDEPYGLVISPKVRRAQLGSGIFTIGVYPEIKLPEPERFEGGRSSMVGSFTDNEGNEHEFRMHLPLLKKKNPAL